MGLISNDTQKLYKMNGLSDSRGAGFFSPYPSFAVFHSALKAPVVMPITCLAAALRDVVKCVENVAMAAVNLATLNLRQGFKHTGLAIDNIIDGVGFILAAIFHSMQAALSLVTRTLSTVVYGVAKLPSTLMACLPSSESDARPSSRV